MYQWLYVRFLNPFIVIEYTGRIKENEYFHWGIFQFDDGRVWGLLKLSQYWKFSFASCRLEWLQKNFKINFKSLLFISLRSDIKVDWSILMFAGIIFYQWWMISTIKRGNIGIYMRDITVGNCGTGTVYFCFWRKLVWSDCSSSFL